jgi:hypothetical protein
MNCLEASHLVKQLFIKHDNARGKTKETAFKQTALVKQLFRKRDNACEKRQKPY